MDATRPPGDATGPADPVEVVVDTDPAAAGAAVRARFDAGRRAAGFVGDPDDPALDEFVTDVLRPDR